MAREKHADQITTKKGRPAGSPNVTDVVDVQPSACPNCGSTEKEYTGSRTVQQCEGLFGERPYNHIVRRRCLCSDCGQTRIERSFELAAPE